MSSDSTAVEAPHPSEAVALATILLLEGGVDVTASNITKVLLAAGVQGTDERYPATFERASALGVDSFELIKEFGKGGFGGGGAPAEEAAATTAAAPVEVEESEEEEESVAGPGLFGDDDSSSEESSD